MTTKPGSRTGTHQANNKSQLPGIRARWKSRTGRKVRAQIDVSWYVDGKRKFSTYPCTLEGLQKAMALREATTGVMFNVSAREALPALVEMLPPKPGERW